MKAGHGFESRSLLQLMMKKYFTDLRRTYKFTNELLQFVKALHPQKWKSTLSLNYIDLPKSFLDPFLIDVVSNFQCSPIVIHFPPNNWYDWHTDFKRVATINSLLHEAESLTMFGEPVASENPNAKHMKNIVQLKYSVGEMYLLDVQQMHAVLNLNQNRYLLSVGINMPENLSSIMHYCEEYST